MPWVQPCLHCETEGDGGGGAPIEQPVLAFSLCGVPLGWGGGMTNHPYLVVVPVNEDGSQREPISWFHVDTDTELQPQGMTPCCCPVFVAC